jgi:hypothetical protein
MRICPFHGRNNLLTRFIGGVQSERDPSSAGITTKAIQQTVVGFPRDKRSYQEAMNRPISIISYDHPPDYQVRASHCLHDPNNTLLQTIQEGEDDVKFTKRYSTLINGNSEESDGAERARLIENKKTDVRLLQNMSSGRGTTNDSKGKTTDRGALRFRNKSDRPQRRTPRASS